MKNFAITGVAGYIAPRHLQAIKETGNNLIAALDPHDSVGILDRYFPEVSFFSEFERFDRHIDKLRRQDAGREVDYVSICSPNFLHDAHIRFALRVGADAICEKPLVLNPWNLDALQVLEKETGKKVYNILQLRVHPSLIELKRTLEEEAKGKGKDENNSGEFSLPLPLPLPKKDVVLTYITSRGPWYHYSWKGNSEKSGGVATNIGVHFFDLVSWLFGGVERSEVYLREPNKMSGFLELKNANVRWFLSIDRNDLPEEIKSKGQSTYRSITVAGKEIEFTGGFTDLHTRVYENILAGKGFGIEEARSSIETVYNIRKAALSNELECIHPYLKKPEFANLIRG